MPNIPKNPYLRNTTSEFLTPHIDDGRNHFKTQSFHRKFTPKKKRKKLLL